ncbi:MAG: AMIN domain-containing protein, partial [Myxococcaceae bacterium]|nr:AMIN domain-containing protein [Myxococcaceae bacterium]
MEQLRHCLQAAVRRSTAAVLACALAAVPEARAQDRVQLNVITKLEVRNGALEIVGTRRASFTTFTLSDPPRLVIDVSEAVFRGVPAETKVNDGLITVVRTASYGSESAAIARILVGLERELESDIVSEGSALLVKWPQAGRAPALARAPEATSSEAERERLALEKAQGEAERRQREDEARRAKEAELERQRLEDEDLRAKAAEAARQAKLEAERRQFEEEERRAKAAEAARQAKLEAERRQ